MAGSNTTNSYFYKPDLGAAGSAEKALFDEALDRADAAIAALVAKVDGGIIPRKTTAEIQAICSAGTDTDVRIFFNITRDTREEWIGFDFVRPL